MNIIAEIISFIQLEVKDFKDLLNFSSMRLLHDTLLRQKMAACLFKLSSNIILLPRTYYSLLINPKCKRLSFNAIVFEEVHSIRSYFLQ